nr:hypothetical protein [Paraburkholderia sp. DHOC27]
MTEKSGRFVEKQDARCTRKRAGNLNAFPLPEIEPVELRRNRYAGVETLEYFLRRTFERLAPQEAMPREIAEPVDEDVFRDRQRRVDGDFLMHERNPVALSFARVERCVTLVGQLHAAVVGLLGACKDFQQCRFASTIFANQCMHFTRLQFDRYVSERNRIAEPLVDMPG